MLMSLRHLLSHHPFGMTIHMEPFATALFDHLRFLVTRLPHGAGETFHMHCFDELDLTAGPIQDVILVPSLIVRAPLGGKARPHSPQDEIDVIDAVLSDPSTRPRLQAVGAHPLVIDFFGAVDAEKEAQQLMRLSKQIKPPINASPKKKGI